MTRWIILSGSLLLGLALFAMVGWYPSALDGFGGLVIWMFLGYCAIIVVAQVCTAVGDLTSLARRQAELRLRSKLQRAPARGEQ